MRCHDLFGMFFRSRSGNVAMMFGLFAVPLLIGAGMALDFLRANNARTALTEAADAGVLAAARARLTNATMTDEKATEIARKHFDANARIGSDLHIDAFDFAYLEAEDRFTLTVKGALKTTLLGVTGRKTLPIDISTEATVAPPPLLEAVLVLDNTGSMTGAKISALKSAAGKLVDSVMKDGSPVKIGIVPFSNYVNVGLSRRNESWITVPPNTSDSIWQCSNTYPNAVKSNCRTVSYTCYNDGVPGTCSYESCDWDYGEPVETCKWVTSTHVWRGCVGSRNNPLDVKDEDYDAVKAIGLLDYWCTKEVLPLTSDKSAVKGKIATLIASGNTYIPSGLFWGQALISSDAPFTEGMTYEAMDTDGGIKAIILMTDGANTLSPNYPRHDGSDVSRANSLTRDLCNEIKSKKVSIYTIAFEVTETDIRDLLRECASDPSNYYDATDAAELAEAFESIADNLKRLALSR